MKKIVCEGNYYNGQYLISMSPIYSCLIKECGRLVDDYNSDILSDIHLIDEHISKYAEDEEKVFWIGLRESGVDHEEFIKYRCENDYYYREIFKIVIEKRINNKCIATMTKSSTYDFRKEHNITH